MSEKIDKPPKRPLGYVRGMVIKLSSIFAKVVGTYEARDVTVEEDRSIKSLAQHNSSLMSSKR